MAIRSYRDEASRDIALGITSRAARRRLPLYLHVHAIKRLAFLDSVQSIVDLRAAPQGYGWEMLKNKRAGQQALRINKQYRICFEFDGQNAYNVEIVDYHN